jgi:hypothetical protein
MAGAPVEPLANLLRTGVSVIPLFGPSEERLIARAAQVMAEAGVTVPDLSIYYKVDAPSERLHDLAAQIREQDTIAAAYVKPPAEPPQINDMLPNPIDAPPITPDMNARQVYLGAAPAGIEALWAQTRPGGTGTGVRIIDIEGAWRFTHEDLLQVQGGVVGGTPINSLPWRNHGTAVIGVFGGDDNAFGVKGIAPNANTRAISIFLNATGTSSNSAKAIKDAADRLSPGDIMLIELHRPGPRHNFQSRDDQLGYIAIEWWEDDFQAILYATSKGIIVVEAAGNGAENLDDALYSVRPAGFPASWTNPFNRANRDSGAILVGAGAPPPGTHGRDHGPDRSRLAFSNYGAALDAQGWGREVTTTGYGDLQGGANEDVWYTDTFSGTSSSSPVVVGAITCLQGNRRATGQPVLTPAQVRQRLRATGSPQQDAPGRPATQRIGNRPNLRQLIGGLKPLKEIKEVKAEKLEKLEVKEKQEKIEKPELKESKLEKVEKLETKEFDKLQEKLTEQIDLIGGLRPTEGQMPGAEAAIEARLAALEAALGLTPSAPLPPAAGTEVVVLPAPTICTTFGAMPIGFGPNPRVGNQAQFLVRQFNGIPAPNTWIVSQNSPNGVFRGLNCGFTCEIQLAVPAQSVIVSLVHFAQPGAIYAVNGNGTLAGSAVMAPQQATVQTFTINGASIVRVIIRCPQDETLLLRFCFRPLKAKEKLEKAEVKEVKEVQKDAKELKEGQKELKELKEKDAEFGFGGGGSALGESQVEGQLGHFITGSMRPDLTAGALAGEADLGTGNPAELSQKLAKEATDTRQAKDDKDVEKLSER